MLKEKRVKSKGITLISLVVTIIILIILAGVSLNILLGENGIVKKSKIASESYNKEAATEAMNLKITNVQISKYAEEQRMPTLKELADNFSQDEDFEYVQETSEIASSSKIISENPTSIYTKLKAYDYEFEINSSLQLASIDGVSLDTGSNEMVTIDKEEYEQLKEIVENINSGFLSSITYDINDFLTFESGVTAVGEIKRFGNFITINLMVDFSTNLTANTFKDFATIKESSLRPTFTVYGTSFLGQTAGNYYITPEGKMQIRHSGSTYRYAVSATYII